MEALDELRAILEYYGLGSLVDTLASRIIDDPTLVDNPTILLSSIRDTPEYRQRFKGNETRRTRGLPELAPADYIQLESAYRETIRANSLPRGFYDTQEDFATFIAADVSPNELNNRIAQGYNAVMQAEPGTKEELRRLYGLADGDIAAFFLDPDRFQQSDAIRKAQAAAVASEARRQADLQISQQQAESLAREGIGREQAQQGFATIGQAQELFNPLQLGEEGITTEEQISGVFGTNAAAAQRIATRQRRRRAQFEAGGSFAGQQSTQTGLTTAGE
jgi:hypothetical protein